MSEKIKSIKATRYDRKIDSIMDKELIIEEAPMSLKEYDEDGHLIHESNWGPGGMLSEKFIYEYQNKLLVKQLTYADEDELGETESFEYDDNGNRIQSTVEYLDGSKDITTHAYNSEGRKIQSTTVDEDGEESQQEFWEFEEDQLTSYKFINDFGNIEEEQKMKYNSDGKLIEKQFFNSLEETEYRLAFEYDESGVLIMESKFSKKGKLIEEKSFSYNNTKKVVLERVENAKETLIKDFKYDENGNETYVIEREEEEEILKYEVWREFDSSRQQTTARVLIYGNGESSDLEYDIKYEYDFY